MHQNALSKKQKTILILILGFISALGPFSIDMYLPGFPAIADDLKTDISNVSLTLTSYFIGISVGQLFYGPIIDRYGRKKPLIYGLILFVLASIGCAWSPNINWLIGLRLFLAFGGCVGMVVSRAVVRDKFENEEVARVFSSLILVMGVAPIIAPTIGGYVTSHLGWRYIFILLAIISILLTLVCILFLKESKWPDANVSLKLKNVTVSYWEVLKNRDFLLYGIAGSVVMAGLFAYIAGSPYVLMELHNLPAKWYGWVFGLNAFAFIGGSQLNRLLLKKSSSEKVSYVSATILFICCILALAAVITNALSFNLLLSLLFVFMLMSGILSPNTTALALMPFKRNAGVASALIGSLRMVSGAVASISISIFHNETHLPMVLFMISCAVVIYVLLFIRRKKDLVQDRVLPKTN